METASLRAHPATPAQSASVNASSAPDRPLHARAIRTSVVRKRRAEPAFAGDLRNDLSASILAFVQPVAMLFVPRLIHRSIRTTHHAVGILLAAVGRARLFDDGDIAARARIVALSGSISHATAALASRRLGS